MKFKNLATLAFVGWAGTKVIKRIKSFERIEPELKKPIIYAAYNINNPIALWLTRNVGQPGSAVAEEITYTEVNLEEFNLHIYRPTAASTLLPILIWIHGGGMVAGKAVNDHAEACEYALAANLVVVSVDYRLAPENPYPAAIDDCMNALIWVKAHAGEIGGDSTRIAVGGMSAGGGLAAALAQRARDEDIDLGLQLLIYPMLDDQSAVLADVANRGLTWSRASNKFGWSSYLGHSAGLPDNRPYAIPARRKNLESLAPAWIGVGDLDLFYDEDLHYAERLRSSGVEVELLTVPGMYHAAERIAPESKIAAEFKASQIAALRKALHS
jgi:acetyl esterase/lipase